MPKIFIPKTELWNTINESISLFNSDNEHKSIELLRSFWLNCEVFDYIPYIEMRNRIRISNFDKTLIQDPHSLLKKKGFIFPDRLSFNDYFNSDIQHLLLRTKYQNLFIFSLLILNSMYSHSGMIYNINYSYIASYSSYNIKYKPSNNNYIHSNNTNSYPSFFLKDKTLFRRGFSHSSKLVLDFEKEFCFQGKFFYPLKSKVFKFLRRLEVFRGKFYAIPESKKINEFMQIQKALDAKKN